VTSIFHAVTGCIAALAIRLGLVVLFVTAAALQAQAFDYARYQATDLDALLARKRPKSGVDLYRVIPMKLKVALAAYAEPCQTGMVIKSLTTTGLLNPDVKITRCIQVRSAKGKQVRLFIQDEVSNFLPKEVPLGNSLTLFAVHLYTGEDGPGLLVNEFQTSDAARSI
jgi:hypothetical protein